MKIGKDKYGHAAVCFAIVVVVSVVLGILGPWPRLSIAGGIGAAMIWGVWKEVIHDLAQGRGTPSWGDMGANVVGASLGAAAMVWWHALA